MGFLDAQLRELVAVIDLLLEATRLAESGGVNGVVGVVAGQPGRVGEELGGRAAGGWRDAYEVLAAGDARISDGDSAVAATVAQIRERSAQTRSRLTAMRAELLELIEAGGPVVETHGGQRELIEAAQARAEELRRIFLRDQEFSEQMSRQLVAAAGIYRGDHAP
ncbi:hypothetical protein [Mycobacterium attenuatum]|uniref:hypothetical protein n=1 Tax=Mycobacterium attenuatum TaxID=2341086 RepID=UPI0010A966EE|nr:hypothetical protein [Mycobacterium attenuatum]